MTPTVRDCILRATQAEDTYFVEAVQSLWSGYGTLDRYGLVGASVGCVVVKHVRFPDAASHPRGWNTQASDQRKRFSYAVETAWYEQWAHHCNSSCRVPKCLAIGRAEGEVVMVMEDLVGAGYPKSSPHVNEAVIGEVLKWLANFHAMFMNRSPTGLWPSGTYWHLDTRPDELDAMTDEPLKRAARTLDHILNKTPFITFVHGDAKLSNFCFSRDETRAAAVDFQYVGGGCGMKDVAYFISSCLDEDECERQETALLDHYFNCLHQALEQHQPRVDATAVESAWRPLYKIAWTDFYRFLQGWSPNHWKSHDYSRRLASEVLATLNARNTR